MYLPPVLNDWGNLFSKIAEFFYTASIKTELSYGGGCQTGFLSEASGGSDLDPEMAQLCYKPYYWLYYSVYTCFQKCSK